MIGAAALLLGLAAPVPAAARSSEGLKLVDYTDEFAQVWDATAALPDAERTAKFKAEFAKILPGFYDHKRMRGATEAQYNERLLKGLKAYPEQRAGVARVSADFARSIAPARASFAQAFGPMRGYPEVYLVNSMGEFGRRDPHAKRRIAPHVRGGHDRQDL